ncbi:DUF5131 family protein [Asaia sp. As-1742]|uniref:DUF5131 family protein n=1 Tax=Asaia sp. As-1742 TaxID=2608325 RepID=UPI0014209E98|nr:phage Gp37/Gp68 family protein [Asaia sp. As-1742]NIE81455.1 phage Gp37/Gp68 family protein [Asaia sp. As-1742]
MVKNSRIEWTQHTFNPWWGCTRISPACKHCYAEAWAKRLGQSVFGLQAERRFFSDRHWREPLAWNAQAVRMGERPRVFCASMADVFEDRRDLDASRRRLWELIDATPQLDWLLLTKRPEHILSMVPWGEIWPGNVWCGVTIEDRERAALRLPHLGRIPACVRFISAEPLLGALDLSPWLGTTIDWVIAGGESGAKARPPNPAWFRTLRDQCRDANVAFHFKQWGEWAPGDASDVASLRAAAPVCDLPVIRLGKKASGRALDGQEWNGLPTPRSA